MATCAFLHRYGLWLNQDISDLGSLNSVVALRSAPPRFHLAAVSGISGCGVRSFREPGCDRHRETPHVGPFRLRQVTTRPGMRKCRCSEEAIRVSRAKRAEYSRHAARFDSRNGPVRRVGTRPDAPQRASVVCSFAFHPPSCIPVLGGRGTRISISVPARRADLTFKMPPTQAARSRMPSRPKPPLPFRLSS